MKDFKNAKCFTKEIEDVDKARKHIGKKGWFSDSEISDGEEATYYGRLEKIDEDYCNCPYRADDGIVYAYFYKARKGKKNKDKKELIFDKDFFFGPEDNEKAKCLIGKKVWVSCSCGLEIREEAAYCGDAVELIGINVDGNYVIREPDGDTDDWQYIYFDPSLLSRKNYRPIRTTKEAFEVFKNKTWIKEKGFGRIDQVVSIGIVGTPVIVHKYEHPISVCYEELFNDWEFADGTPIGVLK